MITAKQIEDITGLTGVTLEHSSAGIGITANEEVPRWVKTLLGKIGNDQFDPESNDLIEYLIKQAHSIAKDYQFEWADDLGWTELVNWKLSIPSKPEQFQQDAAPYAIYLENWKSSIWTRYREIKTSLEAGEYPEIKYDDLGYPPFKFLELSEAMRTSDASNLPPLS